MSTFVLIHGAGDVGWYWHLTETELRQRLGVKFEIKLKGKDRGSLVLSFDSGDDFERLVELLRKSA